MELTDAHLDELEQRGFIILPGFRHGEDLKAMQQAQRRVLPSWDEVKDDPPPGRAILTEFPPPEMALLRGIVHHRAWAFARKWFGSEHIHFRAGCMIARYPGFKGGGTGSDASALHLDNGNNSLLPPSDSARAFGQLGFWHHLEAVGEDQAPLRLIPKEHGRDMSKAVPLVCEAGTLCVFTNYTMHSASDYLRADGQRYTWALASVAPTTTGRVSATTPTRAKTRSSANSSAPSPPPKGKSSASRPPATLTTHRKPSPPSKNSTPAGTPAMSTNSAKSLPVA